MTPSTRSQTRMKQEYQEMRANHLQNANHKLNMLMQQHNKEMWVAQQLDDIIFNFTPTCDRLAFLRIAGKKYPEPANLPKSVARVYHNLKWKHRIEWYMKTSDIQSENEQAIEQFKMKWATNEQDWMV